MRRSSSSTTSEANASRSALTNSTPGKADKKVVANVVLPEPLQPPKIYISGMSKHSYFIYKDARIYFQLTNINQLYYADS